MSLSSDIQSVRKLKPFLDALGSLLSIADEIQSTENKQATTASNVAKLTAQLVEAELALAKAKVATEATIADAEAVMVKSQADRKALAEEAKEAADKVISEAKARAASLNSSANAKAEKASKTLFETNERITAAEALLADLTERINLSRATLKKYADVV